MSTRFHPMVRPACPVAAGRPIDAEVVQRDRAPQALKLRLWAARHDVRGRRARSIDQFVPDHVTIAEMASDSLHVAQPGALDQQTFVRRQIDLRVVARDHGF